MSPFTHAPGVLAVARTADIHLVSEVPLPNDSSIRAPCPSRVGVALTRFVLAIVFATAVGHVVAGAVPRRC